MCNLIWLRLNNPNPNDVVLGGQGAIPSGSVVLGGVEGAKARLRAATDQKSYTTACRELAKYPDGDILLRQLAVRRCVAITKHPVGLFLTLFCHSPRIKIKK